MGRGKCVVPGCNNIYSSKCGKSFFSFPKDPVRCYKWLQFCNLEDKFKQAAELRSFVMCSDHFDKNEYYCGAVPRLKRHCIPTISAHKPEQHTELSSQTAIVLPAFLCSTKTGFWITIC